MAARRLLIVMLILLGLSTLAAALVPPRSLRQGSGTTTAATEVQPTEPAPAPLYAILGEEKAITVGAKGEKPPVVRVASGGQLALKVSSPLTGLLEIPKLGRVEPVAPKSPARFNLLFDEDGSYAINLIGTFAVEGRVVARIQVGKVSPEPARGGSRKARGGGRRGRSPR
ncbi:MAG TPA: hypothetical protein VHH72_10595 [Solirubrobacterales bacterium]|jgi:hypothetical protein|nr:hypothetical protein [Solirubrobacterales bacterium]